MPSSLEDAARKKREIEHHRRIAASAGETWGWTTPAGRYRVLRRISLFSQIAGLGRGLRVLELGCGIGIFTEELAKTGADLIAIDLSEDLLQQARRRVAASTVQFSIQDAENLAFPDETFDCVTGVSILHHLRIDAAVGEVYRVLKRNGRIVFSEPNMVNPVVFIERKVPLLRRLSGNSPDETAFVRWPLRRMFLQARFQDVSVTPFDFLHPWVPPAAIPLAQWMGQFCETLPGIREISGSLLIQGRKRGPPAP